jgi:phospholipase/carboxylesterase
MKTLASPRRITIGPLKTIEFPASEGSPTVVCFHGYGADGADLAPLAAELDVPTAVRWLFPDAPLRIPQFPAGRAWFPIEEERMMRAQLGQPLDLMKVRPAGLDDAIKAGEEYLAALAVPWDKLILGGFSQGAMLALELTLRAPQAPKGLFLLSGTLIDEPNIQKAGPSRKGLKVFQSHGEDDPLLSYGAAGKLRDALIAAGLDVRFTPFPGGHMLPAEAVRGLEAWLGELLA